ncbi:MAG: M20 family metallopeptidase [Saprospiraceae bacterium]|nr:M20 family metallopeptidase [Saprospiraceae bacterium]
MLKDKVKELAGTWHERVVEIRRHLHMHPELSFEEMHTGRYIEHQLNEIGIPCSHGWAGHGVVGMIEGNRPDHQVVALRADIDALPIQEESDVSYRSQNAGVMHACGHDVHTASLLGVARILHTLRKQFDGTVKLIFQPGEERMPGGASLMIEEGVLENPRPKCIIGQHVYPLLPAGTVGFRAGKMMASSDEIELHIRGRGGHGAVPQFTIDPIAISAQIISGLQQLVSRISDPTIPSVLTFGHIASDGGTYNVIPGGVRLKGTFRTFSEYWRYQAHDRMRAIASGIAEGYGAKCDVKITVGYPFLINDESLTARCEEAAREFLGPEHVSEIPMRLTSEDFAFYTHHTHGCFYRLGVANEERGIVSPVHTSTFDIDDQALLTGPALMSWLALNELSEGNHR